MGAVCHAESMHDRAKLPKGNEDIPGYAELTQFHPLLHVGNELAAASGDFLEVISACCPKDLGGRKDNSLTTQAIRFEDCRGEETEEQQAWARKSIREGAASVERALANGKSTLVHCAYGQNRSPAICCAYAVLYLGWSSQKAIAYVRGRSREQRIYRGQDAIHNSVFHSILLELQPGDRPEAYGSDSFQQIDPKSQRQRDGHYQIDPRDDGRHQREAKLDSTPWGIPPRMVSRGAVVPWMPYQSGSVVPSQHVFSQPASMSLPAASTLDATRVVTNPGLSMSRVPARPALSRGGVVSRIPSQPPRLEDQARIVCLVDDPYRSVPVPELSPRATFRATLGAAPVHPLRPVMMAAF